jgi:hypothetical protein
MLLQNIRGIEFARRILLTNGLVVSLELSSFSSQLLLRGQNRFRGREWRRATK